eukprot:1750707-Amphidinium_carterae.1
MARGQAPLVSTILRKVARSAMAESGRSLSSAMLHRSTPRALPRGQCLITARSSPALFREYG